MQIQTSILVCWEMLEKMAEIRIFAKNGSLNSCPLVLFYLIRFYVIRVTY